MNFLELFLLWIMTLNYACGNSTKQAFPESESICDIEPNICPEDSTTCVAKPEKDFYCKCLDGFQLKEGNVEELNKEACIKKEECNFGFPMCPEDSTRCVPKGSNDFFCDCLPGYKLKEGNKIDENKESCLKMSRCDTEPSLCPTNSSKCVPLNTDGYFCECLPGYKRNTDVTDDNMNEVCIEETTNRPQPVSTTQTMETTTDGYKPDYSTQISCDCGPNSEGCEIDYFGNKVCNCSRGYAQKRDVCAECDCGPNSNGCKYINNQYKVCQCNFGYAQKVDMCLKTCNSNKDCLFGGLCLKQSGNSFCRCRSGFNGSRCEINNACASLNATCRANGAVCYYTTRLGKDVCYCYLKKGNRYNINTCDTNNCNFDTCINGNCQVVGNSLSCRCDVGFSGPHCDIMTVVTTNLLGYIIVAGILGLGFFIFLCATIYLCIDTHKLKKAKNLQTTRFQNNLPVSPNKTLPSA